MKESSKNRRTPARERSSATAGRVAAARDHNAGVSSGDAGNTRSTLMELLKRAGETDVASLAEDLGISGVAVRQHLAALERDGKVAQRSVRRPVGRPAKLYRLTEAADQAFPQASAQVALDLLARLQRYPLDVRVVPDMNPKYVPINMAANELDGMPVLSVRESPLSGWGRVSKRAVDLLVLNTKDQDQ